VRVRYLLRMLLTVLLAVLLAGAAADVAHRNVPALPCTSPMPPVPLSAAVSA